MQAPMCQNRLVQCAPSATDGARQAGIDASGAVVHLDRRDEIRLIAEHDRF